MAGLRDGSSRRLSRAIGTPAALHASHDTTVRRVGHMAAISIAPDVHIRVVPRRVMIRCPSTEVPVDTGYGPAAAARIQRFPLVLSDCTEFCGDHQWLLEDAFLE
jgi:hypothetical protein